MVSHGFSYDSHRLAVSNTFSFVRTLFKALTAKSTSLFWTMAVLAINLKCFITAV